MVTSLDTSGITVRRRRRRGDGKQDLSSSLEKENHSPENRGKNPLSNGNISSTVDKFILAAAKTSQAAFWKDKAALVDHVVAASILLRSSSLLLEEHATEILSRCRTLVKEEKEAEVSSNTVNRLCVAVHGLRAVLCTTTTSKRDMVIRLLFFCTVTAADRKDSRYCLAAYNAMCRALENYSVPCIDKDTYIHCEKLNDHGSVIQCPIPQLKPLSKSKYWIIGATDAVQLCTMAISATLAAAQVVVQIEQNSEQDEFGLSLERMSDRVALVRRLICDVAVPWIASSSLAAKKDENLASYCKKAQRILWNLAEDCKDASDRIVLQIDAIRALLLDGSNQDGTVRAILKERNFDNACSISWKVAESLVSQAAQSHSTAKATSIDDAHYNLLQKFHRQVGQVLDAFADAHCPLSYTEYCAYRALHTKSPFRCSNKECSRDCVYRCFLNQYEHQCCETSTTDSCFLALFFLALQVRQLLENGMYDSPAVKREDAMTTVSNFRSKLLRGTPDSAMQIRFYSLLSSINLHRVVDRVLCVESTKEDKCTIQELLDVAATILSSCIGPLCIGLIDNVNEKQGTHLWTFGTACFRQAISIEEIIVRTDAEPNYPKTSRSNMLIGKLSRILTRLPRITPPPDCIENTARVSLCTHMD